MRRRGLLAFMALFFTLGVMAQHNFPDFSRVGYRQSDVAIPDAPVAVYVSWQSGDQSARIQRAIDWIASRKPDKRTGLRGAVLLAPGIYSLTRALRINADGIVLRGASRDKTVLNKKGVDRGAVVYLEGNQPVVTGDTVAANALKKGDEVVVWQHATKDWIDRMHCSSFGGGKDLGYWGWHPGEIDVYSTRTVADVANGVPVFTPSLTAWMKDVSYIRMKADRRMRESGVENLSIVSDHNNANPLDENHAWDGVYVANATDCWVRNIVFRNLAGSAVVIQRSASRITVADCKSLRPVSEIGGYRRRTFYCMGDQCLFLRLYSEHGLHDFSAGLCAAGPNVFSQCESYESLSYSGSLGPWATGLLFDNVNIDGNDLKLNFLGLENYGAGYSTSNSVAYQCTAAGFFADSIPDGSTNTVYGCWGQFNGTGRFAECNNHVKPWSLFADQLEKRIGSEARNFCRVLERPTNSVSNNPTYEEAAQMTALSVYPRLTMSDWIDSARFTAPVSPKGAASVDKLPQSVVVQRPAVKYEVKAGKLLVDGKLLVGGRRNTPWWNGRVRYSAFPKMADAVTRFVPGMEGQGTTTRIDSVVCHLKRQHVAVFNQNYGLWYDRRRDDHERIRRRDGDVWAPFYEQAVARCGKGKAWDGLSKYDLTKLNPWYVYRVASLADCSGEMGLVVLNQHYFQHNILEAGAHWVDCPWRPVNNVNASAFPEPVPFIGDKRIYMASHFYDINKPSMARLHRQYINNMLDAFADHPNIIHSIGEEYTGPVGFTSFWLRTVGEWEKQHGRHPLIALSVNKNVQDTVMMDSALAHVVDIINIEQWWNTSKGLYAPKGGRNMAPRQYFRRMRPGKVTFADVYKSVSEVRQRYPRQAVVYYGSGYDEYGWAVLLAGGSCPAIAVTDADFLRSVASMVPSQPSDNIYTMANDKGEMVVAFAADGATTVNLSSGRWQLYKINEKSGDVMLVCNLSPHDRSVSLKGKNEIYWIKRQ